jgi:RNA recognition motif-containing protein
MSAENDQIVERLGFFFSDANLRIDRFLRQIVLDTYKGGFVEIDTLLKFNTIKKLSTDPAVIAEAATKVESPKLKLNETKTSIARVEPFTEDMLKDNIKVTIRVGNLPIKEQDDGSDYVNTRDEVGELFSEYGKVALVRLLTYFDRKEHKRIAVGKCFVEFASAEGMEKAAADLIAPAGDADAKPNKVLKLGENELTVKTMQQWLDKKNAKKEAKLEKKTTVKREREEEDAKVAAEIEAIEFKLDWKKGGVVTLEGVPDGCDREMILAAVKKYVGEDVVAKADYSRGDKDGKIRFEEPTDKIKEFVSQLNDGSATLGENKIGKAGLLEGEEEEKYFANYIEFRTKQMREKAKEKMDRQNKRKKHSRRN